ncbi:MAG: helix-turn-helix transcriptional regulator [Hyphomicrobiales bacterium]|nr:helix-turn-helix transcriptional regulator [Hyphomicrobiales bacterium]MBV8827257.1 helix-turn-helix transcriptional regulator [Hyphomicrobiales bacterium]MBV9426642.1 helix-turn-helix transcriptional regulator [Bradyrhizobiaceae bacterium]
MSKDKRDPKRPSVVDIAVGRNVRIWRITRGLSQGDLANRLGITFQQVQKYETGHNRMSTGRLVKAAAILDVPISSFFEGVDGSEPVQALLADNRSFRLAHAFAGIKHSAFRLALVALVETLAESLPREPKRRRRG